VLYILWILLESRRDRAKARAAKLESNLAGHEKPAPPRAS
jgi:hypothetical protein